jgi:predicted type IV restriction endonuclease
MIEMTERELILALCEEAGDDMTDPDEVEAGFRINHHPADIRAAADGDVAALLRLRRDCGLPLTS